MDTFDRFFPTEENYSEREPAEGSAKGDATNLERMCSSQDGEKVHMHRKVVTECLDPVWMRTAVDYWRFQRTAEHPNATNRALLVRI